MVMLRRARAEAYCSSHPGRPSPWPLSAHKQKTLPYVRQASCGAFFSPAPEEEWLDLGANLEENFEVMEAHLC